MPGDNIVWQIDSIDDYLPFVEPYCAFAREQRLHLVYFRFAEHPPLLAAEDGADIRTLHPERGFEPFLDEIHATINNVGRGSLFLFDCLSELAADWCSDRMLGNFFMLTCPYLYDHAAIAYFAVLRDRHSFHATQPIANTTQILIDAYHHGGRLYIHPIKVQHRHSVSMYMLHRREGEAFVPVNESYIISEVLDGVPWSRHDAASHVRGYWSRTFSEAESIQQDLDRGLDRREEAQTAFRKLLRMLLSHDEHILELAEQYFTLRDILKIRKRMIGTGLIGGKSVGMLLSRAILTRTDPRWATTLEAHDSFFVGADVFYTYLVQNGCWWMVHEHKSAPHEADNYQAETARRRLLAGDFPEYISRQFADMLDYFGQSPIIVRSSSLLEDNFSNAFAGKYESVFCANQGGPYKRLEDFLSAVRTVYASTMCEEALAYRTQRGLLGNDEQMALLIQRVSGTTYGNLFYPQAAGVGLSFNPYVWHESIDSKAGMVRLVFGVGTRAVNRSDDDYTRIVALNEPQRRPEADFDEVRQYAQRRVDVLDLEANQLTSYPFEEIVDRSPNLPVAMYASRDRKLEREQARRGQAAAFPWVLTFDKLLTQTDYVADMAAMLDTIEKAYGCPVDIEFTLNFVNAETYRINLVQCRPLQIQGPGAITEPPAGIADADRILESYGAVIGRSRVTPLDWVIYVVPAVYGNMAEGDRYTVARLIGELTRLPALESGRIMLIGPGRWGTTTPSLGVPVTFLDINRASILCEIVAMNENLVPDVSLGTHFFNEMVENDMLYVALFPERAGHVLNRAFLEDPAPDRRDALLGDPEPAAHALRVLDLSALPDKRRVILNANTLAHRVICYRE
ncbi:MAG: pyruvate, phosphate dikinase [Lentisphaerae bacterium]|nr:pyruvate, phosphate dikinase [Lentisphaerota bacterium]